MFYHEHFIECILRTISRENIDIQILDVQFSQIMITISFILLSRRRSICFSTLQVIVELSCHSIFVELFVSISYVVNISQQIGYSRACGYYHHFNCQSVAANNQATETSQSRLTGHLQPSPESPFFGIFAKSIYVIMYFICLYILFYPILES